MGIVDRTQLRSLYLIIHPGGINVNDSEIHLIVGEIESKERSRRGSRSEFMEVYNYMYADGSNISGKGCLNLGQATFKNITLFKLGSTRLK